MALVTPILYEVLPTGASSKVDPAPWTIVIGREYETDGMFIMKSGKVLRDDGEWLDFTEGEDLPERCVHDFGESVVLACRAVDALKVDGKTYAEALDEVRGL